MASGDLKAFSTIYDRFANDLYATAIRIVGSSPDAAEIVHNVFVSLFRNAGRFRGNSELAYSWMSLRTRALGLERIGASVSRDPTKSSPPRLGSAEIGADDSEARMILESMADAYFSLDAAWRFTYLNRASAALLGRPPSELIGRVIWNEYPGLVDSVFEPIYRRAAADRVTASITSFYPDHKRWYAVNAFPATRGLSVYFCDTSKEMQLAGPVSASGP
jgi:PAS domain S-box-containing protein